VSFTPRQLYPRGMSPRYPLDRRLGGPQSQSGRGGEEKNFQLMPGLEPPIIQPVAQRYRLDEPGSFSSSSSSGSNTKVKLRNWQSSTP
jgi:hypothetical protein